MYESKLIIWHLIYRESEDTLVTEVDIMSIKEEFLGAMNKSLSSRVENHGIRPSIEVWPEEDEDARWVASHGDQVRTIVCDTPEFRDTPFCGRGSH